MSRRDHAGRNAALLLGRGARQESDALSRRYARRRVADGACGRHGRGDLRRRESHRQFRVPEPGEHLLDEALQRLFQGRFRDGTLPRIRNLVGQPGAAQRGRDAVDRRQPVRRQQALRGRDSHRPKAYASTCATSSRRSSASAPGATTSPRRSRRWTGFSTSTTTQARSSPTGRRSSTRCITALATSASSSRARSRPKSTASSSPAWR